MWWCSSAQRLIHRTLAAGQLHDCKERIALRGVSLLGGGRGATECLPRRQQCVAST